MAAFMHSALLMSSGRKYSPFSHRLADLLDPGHVPFVDDVIEVEAHTQGLERQLPRRGLVPVDDGLPDVPVQLFLDHVSLLSPMFL